MYPHPDGHLPWIERKCLEPEFMQSNYPIIGTVEDADDFYFHTPNPFETKDEIEWDDIISYARELLDYVTKKQCLMILEEQGYKKCQINYFQIINLEKGMSRNIINTYDHIINRDNEISNLLSSFISEESLPECNILSEKEQFVLSAKHLGQMSNQFSLTASQREALAYFYSKNKSEIFAVNGPPGTGKTTLLQSVVASSWIQSALLGSYPELIVASSTNNQAITNILDSFLKNAKSESVLEKRWLLSLDAEEIPLGMYLVSDDKAEDARLKGYLTKQARRGAGAVINYYNEDYRVSCTNYFVDKFNKYFSEDAKNLTEIKHRLKNELKKREGVLVLVIKNKLESDSLEEYIRTEFISREQLKERFERQTEFLKELETECQKDKERFLEWGEFLSSLILIRSLSFLPFLKSILNEKIQQYLVKNSQFNGELKIETLNEIFSEEILRKQKEIEKIENELRQLKEEFTKIFQKDSILLEDAKKYPELDLKMASYKEINSYLDKNVRYEMFLLATHFWECCWLMEEPPFENKNVSFSGIRRQWQISSMLTPILVTTMHTGPAFFKYARNVGEWIVGTDFVDLLIIDEGGQVMPSVAGGMISLSKNALVVGDIKQIEPVFKIPESVDFSNARKFGVVKNREEYELKKDLGILCSGIGLLNRSYGNTMKIAQRRSGISLDSKIENGVWLREHWRCLNEIINYCNELCYSNLLIPSRVKPSPLPFAGFSFVDVKGIESTQSGSRFNLIEAKRIVEWIMSNKELIEDKYQNYNLEFEDLVGIVTPFNAQKEVILKELSRCRIAISKVGTVHSLQGAEKKIVIFSPVYSGTSTIKSYFFDRSPNMLNVAVSRAEDCFVVIGDRDIFSKNSRSPSAILSKYVL